MNPVAIIRHALHALSERVVAVLALLMTFGLSVWAMALPSWEHDAMAAFYALAVLWPCLWHDRRRMKSEVPQVPSQDQSQPNGS